MKQYDAFALKYQHVFISSLDLSQEVIRLLLEAEIRFDIMEGEIHSGDKLLLGNIEISILLG